MSKELSGIKKGQFKPAPQFRTLYYIYVVLSFVFFVLPWFIPVALFVPFTITAVITVFWLPFFLVALYWVPRYYETMLYQFTDTEIEWRRGVWFKKTGIVPYNRITNIDVEQGPISRRLRIASLKLQTAGYSGTSGTGGVSEIKIEGAQNYEELREVIMQSVRGQKPVAVQTYEEESTSILEELIKIRKLLERK